MPAPSKAEIRRQLKNVREDVRKVERALRADDPNVAVQAATDLAATAGGVALWTYDRYPDADAAPADDDS